MRDEDSPLEHAADVYRPFNRAESGMLRGFVLDARRLGRMKFFAQVPSRASWKVSEEGVSSNMTKPDDEALRAAITQFRQIYNPNEPHSFDKTIKLLKRSAHERNGPLRDAAITQLDGFIEAERHFLAGIGVGIVFDDGITQRSINPQTVLDAYFHGMYLHSGNDKSKLARQLDDLEPWGRLTLYSVMLGLRNVYWMTANVVDRVLRVGAILDTE